MLNHHRMMQADHREYGPCPAFPLHMAKVAQKTRESSLMQDFLVADAPQSSLMQGFLVAVDPQSDFLVWIGGALLDLPRSLSSRGSAGSSAGTWAGSPDYNARFATTVPDRRRQPRWVIEQPMHGPRPRAFQDHLVETLRPATMPIHPGAQQENVLSARAAPPVLEMERQPGTSATAPFQVPVDLAY